MATVKDSELRVAHWNVRKLRGDTNFTVDIEKFQRLEKFMEDKSIDILGISETHILKNPAFENPWSTSSSKKHCLLLSNADPVKSKGCQANIRPGVGILVNKRLIQKIDIVRSPDPSRILAVRLCGIANKDILVIEAYGPTEPTKPYRVKDKNLRETLAKEKEALQTKFYSDLKELMSNGNNAEILLLGDFNAKTGYNKKYESIIGPHAEIEDSNRQSIIPELSSKNGLKLIQLCIENGLKIVNNLFPRDNKDKWTWMSPKKTTARIDFIITTSRQSTIKVKSFEIEHKEESSDHRLIWAVLNISASSSEVDNNEAGGIDIAALTRRMDTLDLMFDGQPKVVDSDEELLKTCRQMLEDGIYDDTVDMPSSDDEDDSDFSPLKGKNY